MTISSSSVNKTPYIKVIIACLVIYYCFFITELISQLGVILVTLLALIWTSIFGNAFDFASVPVPSMPLDIYYVINACFIYIVVKRVASWPDIQSLSKTTIDTLLSLSLAIIPFFILGFLGYHRLIISIDENIFQIAAESLFYGFFFTGLVEVLKKAFSLKISFLITMMLIGLPEVAFNSIFDYEYRFFIVLMPLLYYCLKNNLYAFILSIFLFKLVL